MSNQEDQGTVEPRKESATAVREQAVAARTNAARQVAEIQRAQGVARAELEAARKAMEADFNRRRAELEAQLAPMQAELAKMTEVAWTVDLYLGRDEDLTLLRDGTPAPADTPITVRQRILVMAEECLMLGLDYRQIGQFCDWLVASPENLDRVIPDQKGVVVMIPTKVQSRTGNVYEDVARNAANQLSWWFLRNGDRLYLLTVDEKLQVSDRLLPRRNEFLDVFEQKLFGVSFGKPIEPGSKEWLKVEAAADARRRHFMRILMVLQGIADRSPAWQPMRPGGVNFLNVASQDDGRVRLIQDDENTIQLTDGREDFRTWQKRLNQLLRPGLRIIGNWGSEGFRDLYEGKKYEGTGYHPRLTPDKITSRPADDVPHLIDERRDGGFLIRFARTDTVYRRNVPIPDKPGWVYRDEQPVTPSRRATCLVMPNDSWVLPYDLVTVPDLEYYLNSRDNREKAFLSMVPTIRAALATKIAEAAAEQPFRDHLGRLLINEGADETDVATLVDELVHWWKLAKTWTKPLNGDQQHEGKASREILAEYKSRTKTRNGADKILAAGRRIDGVICIAANRQGEWFAYSPSGPAHEPNIFLDVTRIRANGTLGDTKEWQTIPQRSASLLAVAWSDETWAGWKFSANPRHYLTGPQRDQLITELLAQTAGIPIAVTDKFDPRKPGERSLTVWSWVLGTPEDAPLRVTDSPLDWRWDREGTLAEGIRYPVINDRDGLHLGAANRSSSSFQKYSVETPWGHVPWWPDDAHQYTEARSRLVWSDTNILDRLKAYTDRCTAASREEQARLEEARRSANRLAQPVLEEISRLQQDKLHEVFVIDFGHDAEDLWPAHLASLKASAPLPGSDIVALIRASLDHGMPIVGKTLDELADLQVSLAIPDRWGRIEKRIDLKEYGQVVVAEPGSAPEES